MDVVLLSRIQFAMTIGFHYIFPPLSIGLAWIIFFFLSSYIRTKDNFYLVISKFWIKLFSITFAMGVATGITMEFQFGTNWANYSRFVGDIFGAPLAAEGIFAFFLESSFLGVLLYGENKISKNVYCFSSLMVAIGSTLSAFWIIVANSWQQTPAGFEIVNGRAQLVDFMAAVFNPSTIPRYFHTISAALITGGFFVMGISAYHLLKYKSESNTNQNTNTNTNQNSSVNYNYNCAKKSLKVGIIFAVISSFMILFFGHIHAVQVAQTQPAKLAAFEGLWESKKRAPLLLFGIPNEENERTDFEISIPGLLSLLVGNDLETKVTGLKDIALDERPPVKISFFTFHLMVGLGFYFISISLISFYIFYFREENKSNFLVNFFVEKGVDNLILKILFFSIPLPFIANELGWMSAEIGRQPWIVYGILKTSKGISENIPSSHIIFSIILFAIIYLLIFVLWIFLLKQKIHNSYESRNEKA
ncbi:MAG: cytochrome ubiquinol oxidase subunit I [Oligoflexia bacterium]|nr:cytochrome ubiquinol oxidase subunit I [Oligoflexia bacterium]